LPRSDSSRNIKIAFLLNFGFTLLEIVGGLLTNSLAILSDALHDLGDSLSLGLAWYLDRYAKKERDPEYSYGYGRFSLLGALVNAVILVGGSLYLLSRAIPRLLNPEPASAPGMLLLAIGGIAVNGLAVLRLKGGQSLNMQVVAWHLLEDVLGWVAVLIVSIVLLFTDLYILDPILSILITLYVLYNMLGKLKQTSSLFLQAVPGNVDVNAFENQVQTIDQVLDTHHTHIWSLEGEHHVLSTHVVVAENATKQDTIRIKNQVRSLIDRSDFEHITVEIEYENEACALE
jgi:cobalt-zinc-cadmium efflux system protein